MFEITHDSLATKIWEKVSAEEKTLIEVKNFITNSAAIYRSRKVLLTKQDLAYIAPYENKLTLDDQTLEFINRSRRYYRNQKIGLAGLVAFVMAALLIVIIVISNSRKKALVAEKTALAQKDTAQRAEESARKSKAEADRMTKIADDRAENLNITLQSLERQTKKLDSSILALNASNKKYETANKDLRDEKLRNLRQISETKQTLENTKLINEDPTTALIQAVSLYDDINENLKGYLRKNAFDAYREVIYTRDTIFYDNMLDIALLNDNNFLIADGTEFPKIWNSMTGSVKNLIGPVDSVTSIVASPESNDFITVEKNRNLMFWKNYNYVDTANFKDEIIRLEYINHSKEVLIGFRNGNIAVTDFRGKNVRWILHDKKMDIEELDAGKTGNYFITRSSDDKIRYWLRKANSEGTTKTFQDSVIIDGKRTGLGSITAMAISNNNELFIAADSGLHVATKLGDNISIRLENKFSSIIKMGFTNKNKIILLTKTGKAFFYDIDKKISGEIKGYDPGTMITNLVTFAPDRHFVTVGDKRFLKIWDSDISNSWFYRSLDINKLKLDKDKVTYRWMLTDISGHLIDTISFINTSYSKEKTSYLFDDSYDNVEIIWDSIRTRNDSIILSSPITNIDGIDFYESINIIENADTLNIKISEMAGGGGKKRNKLDVQSAMISTCKRFVLVVIVDRDGNRSYYIHPTFLGLSELVQSKNLFKIK